MLLTNLSMGEQPRRDQGYYSAILTVTANLVAIDRHAHSIHTHIRRDTVRDRSIKCCIFMSSGYFINCSTQLHLAITRKGNLWHLGSGEVVEIDETSEVTHCQALELALVLVLELAIVLTLAFELALSVCGGVRGRVQGSKWRARQVLPVVTDLPS